ERGALVEVEAHTHMVPHGDRSGVVIEPYLTDQWYVNVRPLAERALDAVRSGQTRFVPETWEKTYFQWLENIEPWCVSRQLWWGHQIPAWYGPDGTVFVEEDEAAAREAASRHYGGGVELTRDADVLDTWFSSALWPFSTLGWPDVTPELKRYYPTDVLVTGFDIIFFWVARMMMMGLHFMGEVPFRDIYIHALVRDERGQKMSKSKGNVIDPLDLIDEYGCDALRFTLAAMAAQGRDIKLAVGRVEGYRNFATKLWNAARYCEMNGCRLDLGFDPAAVGHVTNRWIVAAVAETAERTAEAIEAYKFNDAAGALYHFTWGTFCDWYLEFTKPILNGEDEAAKAETRATTAWVLDRILHMLHPMMPFITEELWQHFGGSAVDQSGMLISAAWPELPAGLKDEGAAAELDWVVRLISTVRTIRSEMNVPASARIPLELRDADALASRRLETHREVIVRLARLAGADTAAGAVPEGAVQTVVEGATVVLPLAGFVDIAQERARLAKDVEKLDAEIAKIDQKLGNPNFVSRAPEEVVEEQRERRAEAEVARNKLVEALDRLG
ncbi:MAG TPA: valine--tRNA ligase, partial [Arenibaculum sp.]|nr:valine--tRNA ligase [Arenibaculum sp.]